MVNVDVSAATRLPTFAAFLHRLLPRPVAERVCALAGGAMRVVAPRARTLTEATAAIIRGARAGADARLSTTSAGYVTGSIGVTTRLFFLACHLEFGYELCQHCRYRAASHAARNDPIVLVAVSVVFLAGGVLAYQRRDLRVGNAAAGL